MNTRDERKRRLQQQLERAEKAPSLKKVIAKLKAAHPSWLGSFKKYLTIGMSLSQELVDTMPADRLLSLDEALLQLGRATARLEFLKRARELLQTALGRSLRVGCKEVDCLSIRSEMARDLLFEYVWALQTKEKDE